MEAQRLFCSATLLLTSLTSSFGRQGSSLPSQAKPGEKPAFCKPQNLPPDILNHLKEEFGSWRIHEPMDLSPLARERWESEKPLECPGFAVGKFDTANTPSFAVLLVPAGRANGGYRFLVFVPKVGSLTYEMKVIEQSDDRGASNFFIRRVPVSKFFDQASKKKFQVQTSECILLVDSAENEYEADVYFLAMGSYQHEPVDY